MLVIKPRQDTLTRTNDCNSLHELFGRYKTVPYRATYEVLIS